MSAVAFKKAERKAKKARMAIIGPPGAGKTRTSLRIARGLVGAEGKIAVIDTEHGSASMFADSIAFDALELESFAAERYIEAIEAAEAAGYQVIVIDSLSHAWMGKDGLLEFVDKKKSNDPREGFRAWGQAGPILNTLIEKMLTCNAHVIVTLRSKMEHVMEKDERGKTVIRKVGLQPVMRDGIEFEFDLVADIDQENTLHVTKSRIDAVTGAVIDKAGEPFGAKIGAWLASGAVSTEPPKTIAKPALVKPAAKPEDATRVVREAVQAELQRLRIGRGQSREDERTAMSNCVKRTLRAVMKDTTGEDTGDRLPVDVAEWEGVLASLKAEETPEVSDSRDPGADDDKA